MRMFSSAMESAVITASKIRGAMVGSLLGDCLGSAFEGEEVVSKIVLQKYFDKLEGPYFKVPVKMYTDDTAMTKSVAESFIAKGYFDEKDMAKRFVDEYFNSPKRGYGQNVIGVFHKLRNTKLKDVWQPASEQFEGAGSYGNGGAMRIAPVALFSYHNYQLMLDIASKITQLTHTNILGINGALLQCLAVYNSLHLKPSEPVDNKKFLDDLINKMSKIEESDENSQTPMPYQRQLKLMQKLLQKNETFVNSTEIVETLGHSIAALYSVPTAIFCFLRAQKPIDEIKTDNPFRRTLQLSISLGGDADTIASMAGAIAGAYYGYEIIDKNLQKHCEGVDKMLSMADELSLSLET